MPLNFSDGNCCISFIAQGLRSQMARDICATLNVVPDGEELDDQLQATYTALKAHFAGRDMDIAREE